MTARSPLSAATDSQAPGAPPAGLYFAYAALAASMALTGAYVGLSRVLVVVFPVFLLVWLRFAIAAAAMLHWVGAAPGAPPLSAGDRRLLFWQSFLGNFGFSICMLFGVALTSATSAGVVMAALPATVAVLSWWWLGARIERRVHLAILCAGLGIAVMAWARSPSAAGLAMTGADGWVVAGHALLLCAVFCEASYVVIGKRLTTSLSPRRISALINLWGLALMTPLGLWQALSFDFGSVTGPQWALLVFYSLAASVVAVWLWMKGLAKVSAPRAGVFTVLLPLCAAAVGVAWLGEPFGAPYAAALALALAGLLLATWPASIRGCAPSPDPAERPHPQR